MRLFKTPRFFRTIFPGKTWGFSRTENTVYLTFDDGPDPIVTPWILDFLKKEGIHATFFCVGENVEKYPEVFARISEEGHVVGNHSMKHEKGTKTPTKEFVSSVERANNLIDSKLFRPPHGRITLSQTHALKSKYQIVMWTWLSYDFDHSVSMETILDKAEAIKSGDILVLHDNPKCFERVKILLPQLIKIISDKQLMYRVIES